MKVSPLLLVGAAMGAVVLLGGRRAQATQRAATPRPGGGGSGRNESGSSADPFAYARDKLAMLRRRMGNVVLLHAVERWAPELWPGVPVEAVFGYSATSTGMREGADGYPVLGWLPCPRTARDRYAASAEVARVFGRTIHTDRGYFLDAEAQTFCGLWHLLEMLRAVNAQAPASLRASVPSASSPADVWAWELAMGSYSLGPATIGRMVTATSSALAVAPSSRWRALGAEVARRCGATGAGVSLNGVPCRGTWQGGHAVLRVAQRVECGRELGRAEWFGAPLAEATVRALVALI